jgi:hypothetical protein
VKVRVAPYQTLRTQFAQVRSASPFWHEDLMFVVSEPFDDLLHILVEDRNGGKVSGRPMSTNIFLVYLLSVVFCL